LKLGALISLSYLSNYYEYIDVMLVLSSIIYSIILLLSNTRHVL